VLSTVPPELDGLKARAFLVRCLAHAPKEPGENRLQPGLAARNQMLQMGKVKRLSPDFSSTSPTFVW
jgi:hypothetical protein